MIQKVFVIVLFAVLILHPAGIPDVYANDIRVEGTRLIPAEEGSPAFIQFDISWDNSWRLPFSSGVNNWDAAWVFIKYREVGNTSAAWSHLYLSNTPGDYETGSWTGDGPGGAVIDPGLVDPRVDGSGNLVTPHSAAVNGNPAGRNPVVGAFVYRENVGRGRFEVTEMAFAFDLAENGIDTGKMYDFKVFAIEMVYVPQGSFFVGDGTTTTVQGHFRDGASNVPFLISSESQLTLGGTTAGNLANNNGTGMFTNDDFNNSTTRTLPAAFPKGFLGFYTMKYSITQQQYVDFLNTLTYTQQDERINRNPNASVGTFAHDRERHTIRIAVSGIASSTPAIYETTNPFVGNNYMSWVDGAAYMDWSGLRPFSELEYEKSARGFASPVANEYAWGTNQIANLAYTLSNAGEANEGIATNYNTSGTAGNALTNSTRGVMSGPFRVGIFAAHWANISRVTAGSSYWGIMELSGNLSERTVTVGNEEGRAFTGLHGDGALSTAGHADVSAWPGMSNGQVTGSAGSGSRGGTWISTSIPELRVSQRRLSTYTIDTRSSGRGFRGVRTAGCLNNAATPTFDTSGGRSPNEASTGQLLTYKVTESGAHLWIVPNDWDIITGQGTNEITVIAGPVPATIRVAAVNSCGAGAEETINVNRTLEPYTLVLDDFFDATAQERYTVRLGISTTRDANLLFRTRPVPGEVDRQMRFDGFFFDTINPSGGSKPHGFETTGQPDGEFLATIRDVPAGHTIIIFDMIADDFPIGSSTFKFELEVFDIDRQEIIFQQVFEESYVDF